MIAEKYVVRYRMINGFEACSNQEVADGGKGGARKIEVEIGKWSSRHRAMRKEKSQDGRSG
jgi:hypothetical protein